MCYCCLRLHRHQIHLISYGFVSLSLLTTGFVFTVFAIFQKDSQIGKIWLAGPTTMVVGMVLLGKVMIDWGPAMLHGRHGSMDSAFLEQFGLPNGDTKLPRTPILPVGAVPNRAPPPIQRIHSQRRVLSAVGSIRENHLNAHQPMGKVGSARTSPQRDAGLDGAIDCIVYGQLDSASMSNTSSYEMAAEPKRSNASAASAAPPTPMGSQRSCNCSHVPGEHCQSAVAATAVPTAPPDTPATDYGSIGGTQLTDTRSPPSQRSLYQGETFVINERSYLI